MIYNVVLVSTVQRRDSATCRHIPAPSGTSLPLPLPTHRGYHRALHTGYHSVRRTDCLLKTDEQDVSLSHDSLEVSFTYMSMSAVASPPVMTNCLITSYMIRKVGINPLSKWTSRNWSKYHWKANQ